MTWPLREEAGAATTDMTVPQFHCELSWISIRACYRPADRDEPPTVGSPSGLVLPPPLLGIMCTMFAVGAAGHAWLRRITASPWFVGLQPMPEDLGAGERPEGRWVAQSGDAARDRDAAVYLLLAEGGPPRTHLASIAVMDGADGTERSLAVVLARALAGCSTPSGQALRVVSTLGEKAAADVAFVERLRRAGVVVVAGDDNAPEERLHHFPARAVTIPRSGQWVGVDLADHLEILSPGAAATLHSIPSDLGRAIAVLATLRTAWPVRAIILNFHVSASGSPLSLREIDELASYCRYVRFPESEQILFTTREGTDGTVDLLLVGATG